MNTTRKTPLALLADAADELHTLADRLTDAAEELLPEPTPAPVALPTVDEAVEAIIQSMRDGELVTYRTASQAVLDLIAERVPVWVPVEPGTAIKAGTRYRIEWYPEADDEPTTAAERVAFNDCSVDPTDPGRYYIDPRTVPAEPDDPRGARARAIIPVLQKVKNVPLGGDLLPLALDAVDALDEMRTDR